MASRAEELLAQVESRTGQQAVPFSQLIASAQDASGRVDFDLGDQDISEIDKPKLRDPLMSRDLLFGGPARKRLAADAIRQRDRATAINGIAAGEASRDALTASGINPQMMPPGKFQALERLGVQDLNQQRLAIDEVQAAQGITETPQQAAARAASVQSTARSVAEQGFAQQRSQEQRAEFIFDREDQVRTEYMKRVNPAVESQNALATAKSQMEFGTPAAVFNTVRLFTRQLDQSMFASDEFRAQINTSGIEQDLANLAGYLAGEGALGAQSRADLMNSMDAIDLALNKYGQGIKQQAQDLVQSYADDTGLSFSPERATTLTGFSARPEGLEGFTSDQFGASPEPPPVTPVTNDDGSITVDTNAGRRRLVKRDDDG